MLSTQDKKILKIAIYRGVVQVIEDFVIPKYQRAGLELEYLRKSSEEYKKRIIKLESAIA